MDSQAYPSHGYAKTGVPVASASQQTLHAIGSCPAGPPAIGSANLGEGRQQIGLDRPATVMPRDRVPGHHGQIMQQAAALCVKQSQSAFSFTQEKIPHVSCKLLRLAG